MILTLSTGSVRHAANNSVLESIHLIEQEFAGLIDGIELCFILWQDFEAFELDGKTVGFLKKMRFNTLHAPVKEIEYGSNGKTKGALEKIREIHEAVGLRYVTFHPNHVKEFSSLEKLGLPTCIENLPDGENRKGWQFPLEIKKFLEKHPELGFCFDINHGMANGVKPREFIAVLEEKIDYIHLNATERAGEAQHNLLVESSRQVQQKIKPALLLGKPIVIEVDMEKEKVPLIRKEIELVREFSGF